MDSTHAHPDTTTKPLTLGALLDARSTLDELIGDRARNKYYHERWKERYKRRYGKYPPAIIVGKLGSFVGPIFLDEVFAKIKEVPNG